MEHSCVIYKITNKVSGKSYVGQTCRGLKERWRGHKSKSNKGSTGFLHSALRKYGKDAFKVEVLMDVFYRNNLNGLEIALIAYHNTLAPNGYNLTSGGKAKTQVTEETRKKISASLRGRSRVFSEEHKKNISIALIGNTRGAGCRGKSKSEETKKRLSIAHSGKKLSNEHKKKIRDSAKRGTSNHNSRGKIYTPFGIFNSNQQAAMRINCAHQTISKRCNNPKPQWSKWYYEKPKSTESQQNKCDSPKQKVSLQK